MAVRLQFETTPYCCKVDINSHDAGSSTKPARLHVMTCLATMTMFRACPIHSDPCLQQNVSCFQERAAQQPEAASQQAEQQDFNAPAANAGTAGCVPPPPLPRTPSKAASAAVAHVSPAQQLAGVQSRGASPLAPTASLRYEPQEHQHSVDGHKLAKLSVNLL